MTARSASGWSRSSAKARRRSNVQPPAPEFHARTYEIVTRRAGRRVDVRTDRGLVEVTELTRGGTPVRTARFMATRVLALVEHPAERQPLPRRSQAAA